MVFGVSIAINGTINEVSIPPKTTDVLEWIRKKYKNPDIQFQGKIQDPLKEERWLSIFASMSGDEEHTNSHILPSPFDEESYTGPIVILANTIEQQDEYDAPASSYINLKPDDYETLYSEWSFVVEEEEEENLEEEPEEEEEDAEITIEEEEEEEEPVRETIYISKPITTQTKDVFVSCAIRDKVIENFNKLLEDEKLSGELENAMLHVVTEQAIRENMDVDFLIGLTHLMNFDKQIIRAIPNLNMILGGHTHDPEFNQVFRKNGTSVMIIKSGWRWQFVAQVDIIFKGKNFTIHPKLYSLENVLPDLEISDFIQEII